MQHKKASENKKTTTGSLPPFSYRVAGHLSDRFARVVQVSKRTKASILHEALENKLPALENQYAPELKKLKAAA